ncbi:MAG: peptidylprolyl isomerase [Nitrospirae bacterium]|nr:peptidylprolyl isomerase [Nitrospirota bacterium]
MKKPLLLILKTLILSALVWQLSLPAALHAALLLDRVVATVNSEVITWSELRSVVEMEGAKALEGLEGDKREEMVAELEKFFLNSMIDVKLQVMEAGRFGLSVSDAEIEAAVSDIRKRYNLSAEAFAESLMTEGFTMQEYKKRLSEQILLSKIAGYEVKNSVLVTENEIDDYYKSAGGEDVEEVRIRQIFFSMPKDEGEKNAIEARANEIFKKIESGDNFAALAMEFSEDASREFGGDLGFVGHGAILKTVEDAAFALKPGETSKPFWSTAGLHIIKVEEKRQNPGLMEPREKVKEMLFQKKYNERYDQWIKSLREKAYIEVNL